jgi:hypothetical protein
MTSIPPPGDRRQRLLSPGAQFNGIDYVNVAASQTQLFVHFLNDVAIAGGWLPGPPVTIIGGEVITTVAVNRVDDSTDWSTDSEGRPILTLTVTTPGDFSTYQLTMNNGKLDPYFATVPFSFRANCPTTLDCAAPAPSGSQPASESVPFD